MTYIELEKLHRLFDGYRQRLRLSGRDLLLIQEQGRLYLLDNRCPHRQSPLHGATVDERCLRCPAHGITFDLATGRALNADDVGALSFVPLAWRGNTVGVELER